MRRLCASAALSLLLLAALSGCGGGGGPSTAASTPAAEHSATAEQGATATQPQPSHPKGQHPHSGQAKPPTRHVPTANPTPGSKAVAPGVPTTKGRDNSIQAFGTEGEEGPREEAVSNLLAYLDARLAGEWDKACSLASSEFREQLQQLIENAKAKGEAPKPKGCPETLELLTPEEAKATFAQRAQVKEILSFRVEGEYAYLVFKGEGGKAMFIAMNDADGQWRVNVLEPEAFESG